MAAQQMQFLETIRGMKQAIKRHRAASPAPSSSASDSDGQHVPTNRGNKLKRSARYAHEGRLDTTGGQAAYKRKIQHAGYERHIIAKKPRLYDEDGDVVDPADVPSDVDEAALGGAAAGRDDAFGGVRLEELLRPLTSAAELPTHPGYSKAYTSTALTQMAAEAAEMVRRETAGLWKVKALLRRFRGDGGWMACGRFETEGDEMLVRDGGESGSGVASVAETDMGVVGLGEEDSMIGGEVHGPGGAEAAERGDGDGDVMEGVEARDYSGAAQDDTRPSPPNEPNSHDITETAANPPHPLDQPAAHPEDAPATNPTLTDLAKRASSEDRDSSSNPSGPSHAMTTRARARPRTASPSPSPSDSASAPGPIHPWYLTPPASTTDPNIGLPSNEAEETRRLLMLYVQKQENIVRQLGLLYEGLQRTERVRRGVWGACRAEGHVGPVVGGAEGEVRTEMSDGEDWYDVEDWGLQGELEKGKDEVEDAAEEEGRRVGGRRRRVVGR